MANTGAIKLEYKDMAGSGSDVYDRLSALAVENITAAEDTTGTSPSVELTRETWKVRLPQQQIQYLLSNFPTIAAGIVDINRRMTVMEGSFERIINDVYEVRKIKKSLIESKKLNRLFLATSTFFFGFSLAGFVTANVALGVGSLGPAAASLVGFVATRVKKD